MAFFSEPALSKFDDVVGEEVPTPAPVMLRKKLFRVFTCVSLVLLLLLLLAIALNELS